MGRFNEKTKNVDKIQNYEGGDAYVLPAELELYSLVVTSLFADKYYESTSEQLARLRTLIVKVDPAFVAKLAVYAREEMHLRTIPLVLLVELAKSQNGDNTISTAVTRVIQRADEMAELLAYYAIANDRTGVKKISKLSKQLKKGLQHAFLKFDEYSLAKWDKSGAISLRDVLFLTNTKPPLEKEELFKKIVAGTLATPYTWETELSAKGNTQEVWTALIHSGKLGYMALLRNLRNILNASVDATSLQIVAATLADPWQVTKSKQLPFRFLSAYRELKDNTNIHTSVILDALNVAIMASADNIRGFDEDTTVVISCDVSGSMQSTISEKSKVMHYDIGLCLGMLLKSRCKTAICGMFGDTFKVVNLPTTSILQNIDELHRREGEVGYSTNGHLTIDYLLQHNVIADKVMMFTDCQLWDSYRCGASLQKSWTAYKQLVPSAKLYLFDLAGYENTPISVKQGDVYLVSGWSEKIFDVLNAYDIGSNAVSVIKKIVL